jgi:uncharacterized OB-fold protein
MYTCDSSLKGDAGGVRARCADGTLMILRCADCGKLFAPLTAGCSTCALSELEWVPSSGTGSILSWRVVERAGTGRDGELMPLTVAVVELDEGPWVYTSIEGDVPLAPVGPVRVHFQPRPWVDRFPVFAVSADKRSFYSP